MRTTTGWQSLDPETNRLTRVAIERRDLRNGDVAVRIDFCGVCHSDLHRIHGMLGEKDLVRGHEATGVVTEIGSAVTGFAIGDAVAIGTIVDSCGECAMCLVGQENYCYNRPTTTYGGVDRIDGTPTLGAYANARNVVAETQRILALLRRGDDEPEEDALRPTPSFGSLDSLIASFEGIGLDVYASISLSTTREEPVIGVTVYRLVQEALTNAYRHGEGGATVTVTATDHGTSVSVENAISHTAREHPPGSGLGLVGMRERVESCGGTLTITTAEDRFRVEAEISAVGAKVS